MPTEPSPEKPKAGFTEARWLGNETVELVQDGHMTRTLVEQEYQQLVSITRDCRVRWVLSDALTVTSFESSIWAPARAIMEHLRSVGARQMVVVVKPGIVHMMARILSYAAELPISPVATREEAVALLRRLQSNTHGDKP